MGANPKAEWIQSHFLPYQQAWIYDPATVALALKSRQIGFSDGTAGRCIDRGHYAKRPQIVISASQKLADELLATIRTHCEVLAALGNRSACAFRTNNSECVEWRSGGRVIALASSARTGRSFHGDVYFDEFAFHDNPEKLWSAAAPMASNGDWQLRVISTPNGAQGLFHKWAEADPPKGWSIHRVTVDDAEAMGKRVDRAKLLELVGGDERLYGEAYLCQFLDARLQYLPTPLLQAALAWEGGLPDLAQATWHAGLDVGRKRDVTALAVVAVVGGVAYVVSVLTCPRTSFDEQKRLIRHAREVFRWDTLHIDETGIGTQLAEELVEEFGAEEARPVQFTEPSKADLCTRTLRWLKNRRLRLPKDATGAVLHKQGISLRRVVTDKNHVSYQFPRTADGHGDEFTALMLALKGAGEPPVVRGLGASPLFAVA
jgi:phage FluMu gp28-like protein